MIQPVDEKLAAAFGLDQSGGVLISDVVEDSAAAEAGLQPGDIVLDMDGWEVKALGAFRNRVAEQVPGAKIKLRIFRDGEEQTIKVTTRARDEEGGSVAEAPSGREALYDRLGMELADLTPDLARRLGYEADAGVLITGVEQGSPAWSTGLRRGELIVSINRRPVDSVEAAVDALTDTQDGSVLLLVANRQGSRYVALSLE
jgi:serine protease Do